MRKESFTMDQYISKHMDLVDFLLPTGETLFDREQALYVIGGLDVNYTSLITNITNKK